MDLTSAQFDEGASIPRAHTCDGEDIPPDLRWSGVPGGIVELALTCEDPDAPSGTFVHWVAWGIDPSVHLRTDSAMGEGTNGFERQATRDRARQPGTARTATCSRSPGSTRPSNSNPEHRSSIFVRDHRRADPRHRDPDRYLRTVRARRRL
jgi:phosphatidylethanolamine-binding protein (PEBP) family uncharacterized protein